MIPENGVRSFLRKKDSRNMFELLNISSTFSFSSGLSLALTVAVLLIVTSFASNVAHLGYIVNQIDSLGKCRK